MFIKKGPLVIIKKIDPMLKIDQVFLKFCPAKGIFKKNGKKLNSKLKIAMIALSDLIVTLCVSLYCCYLILVT